MRKWIIVLTAVMFSVMDIVAGNPDGKSVEVVRIAGVDYYLHTVTSGETVYSLSKLYGVTEQKIYDDNPSVRNDGLKAGEVVRLVCNDIPEHNMSRRKLRRTFIQHIVQPGETAYGIAKLYSIAINTLIEDNPGLDPSYLQAGQELLIRKSEVDKTSPQQIMAQMDSFAFTLSEVSNEYVYHLVEMGETLYGISKQYDVDIADIEAVNDVRDGLKAGVLLKIPICGEEPAAVQQQYRGAEHGGIGQLQRTDPGHGRHHAHESADRTPGRNGGSDPAAHGPECAQPVRTDRDRRPEQGAQPDGNGLCRGRHPLCEGTLLSGELLARLSDYASLYQRSKRKQLHG